jgi:hypothetical protein
LKFANIDDLRLAERAAFAEWEQLTNTTFGNAGTASAKQYSEVFALRDKWKELARLLKIAEEKVERAERKLNPPPKVEKIPSTVVKSATIADLGKNTPAPKKSATIADLGKNTPAPKKSATIADLGKNTPAPKKSATIADLGKNTPAPKKSATIADLGKNTPAPKKSATIADLGKNTPAPKKSATIADLGKNTPAPKKSATIADLGKKPPAKAVASKKPPLSFFKSSRPKPVKKSKTAVASKKAASKKR